MCRSISGRIRKIQKDTEEGARGALKRLNRQLNRLPTYAFDNHQSYTVAERVGSVAYNGARFASLGLLGGSVGQFITDILTGVLATRNQPARVPPPTAPLVDFPDATLPVPDVPVELVVDPTVVAAAAGPQASSQATSVAMSVAASVADSVAPSASIRLASSSLQLSNIVDAVPFDADLMGPAQMELSAMDVPDPALLAAMGLFPSQPRSLVPGIAPESSLLDAFRAAAAAEASADVVAGPGAESAPTVLDYLTSMAEPVARVPAIVTTAAAWAVFLGVSSNVRYQLVCGVEQWLEQGPFSGRPKALGAVMTVLRLGNNVLGGFQYVQIAEFVRATMR